MTDFHSLLRRQVKKYFGGSEQVPDNLAPFLTAISSAYDEFDDDRKMLERAMDLSSAELLQANRDIQGVLEGLLEMLFRVDASGHIIDCRIRASSDLLISADDLAGKRIQDIPIEEVASQYNAALRTVSETGQLTSFTYEIPRHGKLSYYEGHLLPLHGSEYFLIIRNITESVEAASRERDLQHKLAQSERMESLGVLAGGVAHDLNNLLGPLVAYPELILAELGSDTTVKKDLDQIRLSALRAAALIQDLLTLARRGARKQQNLNVSQVVLSALSEGELVELKRKCPKVEIQLKLNDNAPPVFASAHHITQCICNLIMNAYEAIENEGVVSVTVSEYYLANPVGHYEEFTPGNYLKLSVQDSGSGISGEDATHIFEPFYTKKKMGRSGSGLGLSVVYGVVQDNHGLIEVKSMPGQGCRFDLYLPVAKVTEFPDLEVKTNCCGKERLLIVEDELEQRKLSDRILSRLGYHVVSVENGRAAVEYLKTHSVDLVLLDMIMEDDFDGLRTYQEMIRLHPGQPCIIVSGFAESVKVKEAQRLGAGSFVRKPYSIEDLVHAVRDELDKASPAGKP